MIANKISEPIYITRPLLPDLGVISNSLHEIWESKRVTNNGAKERLLEQELKDYLGVEHLSLFNNGTLALLLGFRALGLKGEVITTPFTFPATVQALDWNGLTPVFCDVEPETMTIDATKIERLITEKTSAILGVHVFGNPCNVNKIQEIADKYQLKVIYDGAHAFGMKLDDKPISDYGDMTMFSFHATKLFNTIEGGALIFKDHRVASKLAMLKNFGLDGPENVILSGLNAKMNEVQAAIGLEVLKLVKEERGKRHAIKESYEQYLASIAGIRILTSSEKDNSSYQYFVIEINEEKYGRSRDWLHDELNKNNIFARKYFYPLCSDFSWYKSLESVLPDNLTQANVAVKRTLALPYYGELGLDLVQMICEIIKKGYKKTKQTSDML
ncbi:DegT/DnrJ/EryC1/StrS family aminotransferase [Lederbergia citrisecunda]|uniref:DegT/DnrJ/EryC1/StrS family aminotransferase n=1 Tax=Lederbergia citrisecunda TaxID=2833583 RepID=UPI003D287F9C